MLYSSDHSDERTLQQAIAELKKLDQRLDFIRLPVIGDSMAPMLKDRDILDITFSVPGRLTCGDIIVWGKYELVTHRIVVTRRHRVYTKGDARYWIDPVINHNDILGIVKKIDRNGLIADMGSKRWKIINRLIGVIGWVQVNIIWQRQMMNKHRNDGSILDRVSFWVSKKLNWVILLLFASRWVYHKPLRMDERC